MAEAPSRCRTLPKLQGTVSLSNSATATFQLGGVPAATGDSITLSATASNGATCLAEAPRASTSPWAARRPSRSRCSVRCLAPTRASLLVNAGTSYCGTWTGLATNGSEAYVGESVTLTATATGPDPSNLGYTWTMSNPIGVFGVPTQADGGVGTPGQDEAVGPSDPMQFQCISPGTTAVTLVVDDGK